MKQKAGRHNKMKKTIAIAILLTSYLVCICFSSNAQTYYRGLERMCSVNEKGVLDCYGAPEKWYHLNTVLIENDSIFMYKVPVVIKKKDTIYSASDGSFYYYYGTIHSVDTSRFAFLVEHNCDYCGKRVKLDSLTGYRYPVPSRDTLKFTNTSSGIKIGRVNYKIWKPTKKFFFPARQDFYFDSNSIYRINPIGQYKLISQGIKNFLQTKDLKLDHDTLSVCTDIMDFDGKIIFTIDKTQLQLDTTGITLMFYTLKEISNKVKQEGRVIRCIQIRQIIDYWKAARISLTYKLFLPKNIHHFSEREYMHLFEYNKVNGTYELIDGLHENSWGLVEKQ